MKSYGTSYITIFPSRERIWTFTHVEKLLFMRATKGTGFLNGA